MKLKYIGESFDVDSLTNGKIYETKDFDNDFYSVIEIAVKITFMRRKNLSL